MIIISKEEWDRIVDGKQPYEHFIVAAAKYPAFLKGRRSVVRREIAAFLAHVYQETRFVHTQEIRCVGKTCDDYGDVQWGARRNVLAVPGCTRAEWECRYFGRGPMQLTWYLNYLDTSMALFSDDRLVREPWLVAEDPVVGWTTAIHFWMTNRGREPVTAHEAIRAGNFGQTISVINGNQECGRAWDARAQTRVDTYLENCKILGIRAPPVKSKKLKC